MFKVFITKQVLDRISRDIQRPYERIGLLMGTLDNGSLWVNDIVQGGSEIDAVSCCFPKEKLARIATAIVEGRVKGRIVGWYHSHPGHGLFMSQTDVQTHMRFYQFSPFALSMVVDPTSDLFGLWIYENASGLVALPSNQIHVI